MTDLGGLGDVNGSLPKTVMPDKPIVDTALPSDPPVVARDLHEAVAPVASFEDFYAANAGRIGAALELTLQNSALAEDALNEAMARALQRWKQVGGYTNPSGWVYRVGVNWAQSWRRRRRREQARPMTVVVRGAVAADALSQIEPALPAALQGLSVDHRAVVVCRFHLDLSTAETAEALDIAEGTVKSRLSRALDQLRTELGVTEEER